MFGTLVNNTLFMELKRQGLIKITPFDESLLKSVHYPLSVKTILSRRDDGSWKRSHDFDDDINPYVLEPNEYVVVQIDQRLEVGPRIVGHFIPSSNLIEHGLGLTAGRLEYPFGKRNERVRFGIKNLLDVPNQVTNNEVVAYVEFYDLRGLGHRRIVLGERDIKMLVERVDRGKAKHAMDAGPNYEDDEYYEIIVDD